MTIALHYICNPWVCGFSSRHWQDLGYLIIYVTGRPDMQKQRVVAWLAQHNFPHGIVSFCDGLVHDPLRHKANFLKSLITDVSLHLLKYDRSTGGDCCSSNCPCQQQTLGSSVAGSRRLISVHFIFILLLLHKLSMLLNCVISALHCSISSQVLPIVNAK